MSDHYLQKLVTEARVCREDAEANAERAEQAEQKLAKVVRELDSMTGARDRLRVPAGHMLSVTVTPYDSAPVEAEASA